MMIKLMNYLGRQSAPFILMLAVALALLIGSIDVLAGPEYAFSLLFLIPVTLVAWFSGKRNGVIFSIVVCNLWMMAELVQGRTYSHPAAIYGNALLNIGLFMFLAITLSDYRRVKEHEKEWVRKDQLTGAANAPSFYEAAQMEIHRSRRYNRTFSVAYLDVDNFKSINAQLGHSVGDDLLKSVVASIQSIIRSTDMIARIGGDEFTLLLPETDYKASIVAIDKIKAHLSEAMEMKNWPVTFSIGVVTFMSPPDSVDEILRKADDLKSSVKRNGKNKTTHLVMDEFHRSTDNSLAVSPQ